MEKKIHILLDNGHGENTAGKRSPLWDDGTQLFEYEFNRLIVNGIAKKLKDLNILYEIIVPENKDISLTERVKRINKYCKNYEAKNCLLISIHSNAFNGKATGWECFSTKGKTNSDLYAELFCNEAEKIWGKSKMRFDSTNKYKNKEENYTILYCANCPAILTENFFMDNYNECKYLQSEDGQNEIIQMHVNAILKSIELWENKFMTK